MKKIFKSLSLSIVMAFTMSITPLLSSFDGSNVSFIEAASKQTFKTFTVNSVYSSSTKITGKGTKGASVKAYVNGTQIGKSSVSSSGTYSIKISNFPSSNSLLWTANRNYFMPKTTASPQRK